MDKRRLHLFFTVLSVLVSISALAQNIQVDDTYTGTQLIQNVLVQNQCISVSSVSVSGGFFDDGTHSYGYFNSNGSIFPLQEGVILSTGRAIKAIGPNTTLQDDGGGLNWGGDTDLQQSLGINNSVNATVLEFDFIPLANNIHFSYLLASEEYHDTAPCTYSDGFAFLLKEAGSTAPYQNLAIVPGTDIPVKVTSVHPAIPGACPAQNEQYFDAFNGTDYPTNFNGQTKVMDATATVVPGTQYHIKLVIADEGNYRYDSAIFLGGGSFNSQADLGPDRLFATNNPLCNGEAFVIDGTTPSATGYQWYKDGAALSGATSATYTATSTGTYKVEISFTPSCAIEGEITLEYSAPLTLGSYTLLQCDDDADGLSAYNLEQAGQVAANGNTNYQAVGYFLTQNDADNNTNAIANPSLFYNTTPLQPIYVRIQDQYGCHGVAVVTLDTSNNPLATPAPMEACDTDEDGYYTFDLTTQDSVILNGLPSGVQLKYYPSYNDALVLNNPITTPEAYTNTIINNQTVYARLTQGNDCYGIVPVQLIVYTFGAAIANEEITLCQGDTVTLDAGSGFTSYLWDTTPAQTAQTITTAAAGTYKVTLTNIHGCVGTKTFTVNESGIATSISLEVNDFNGGYNSIKVLAQGLGDYIYSIDGIQWQNSNVFTGLESGEYTIFVKDENGCGIKTKTVFVLDYPNYFTPNGDSVHDTWYIRHLNTRPNVRVKIFDRYGKLLYGFFGNSTGWDGTLNGNPLPASDYWFTITLENGRVVRGHFSLIR